MDKNILRMSMIERFKYINNQKEKKYNGIQNKRIRKNST